MKPAGVLVNPTFDELCLLARERPDSLRLEDTDDGKVIALANGFGFTHTTILGVLRAKGYDPRRLLLMDIILYRVGKKWRWDFIDHFIPAKQGLERGLQWVSPSLREAIREFVREFDTL